MDVISLMPIELLYFWLGTDKPYLRMPRLVKVKIKKLTHGKKLTNFCRFMLFTSFFLDWSQFWHHHTWFAFFAQCSTCCSWCT